ncbi:hypothetical protein [Promicromonospora panici]|uniref:hypothetical protein n=1 Tax=Promicromonospora panici TaxID=2219658 RepID=UPI00101D08DB|nr:hypothetical protein [Promicromonospora panici]
MSDLVVTSIALDDAEKQLAAIVDEFKGMDKLWGDGTLWGHDAVKSAMDDFIDSWWVKREKLTTNLSDLQKKMKQASEQWNNLEVELAKSFDEQ